MERFVRSFIITSIIYLGIASIVGVLMLSNPEFLPLKFIHSHLMLLGWVSMMIFGVGYHILPRFTGRPLKSPKIGEIQFWMANTGLIGMVLFYTLGIYSPEADINRILTTGFGILEIFSILLFLYNMLATLLGGIEEQG